MSWRVVVISHSAKLDYKMNYMMVRQESIIRIHLSEVGLLMIESTAVAITASLLAELVKRKVKVVFCDEKRNPAAELVGYYGSHDTSAKIRQQICWPPEAKQLIWTEIVAEKIRQQREVLRLTDKQEAAELLDSYLRQLQPGDCTNREGHAAKVYFNALFGMDFSRSQDIPLNAALNYGYSILLSMVNREIVANGYITQLGLFHDNIFNQFNLGSDLMEPFRPLVDGLVYDLQPEKFEHDEKMAVIALLNQEILIDGKCSFVNHAIKQYCHSVFEAISAQDISLLRFWQRVKAR